MTVVATQGKIQKVQPGPSELVRSIDRSLPPNVVQITRLIHWLLLAGFGFVASFGLISIFSDQQAPLFLSPCAALFALFLWLVRKQNEYTPIVWRTQLVVFLFGLLAFPTGTVICGLVLWAWFKPETKAWFGCS